MKTRNILSATREEWGGGQEREEGEGTSQRTCMNDPWT